MNKFGFSFTGEEAEKLSVSTNIKESIVAGFKILESEIFTTVGGAEGLKLKLEETESGSSINSTIYFKGKSGDLINFGMSKILTLSYLLKVNERMESEGAGCLVGKEIGCCVKMSVNGKYLEKDIEAFYSLKANMTWAEIKKGLSVGDAKEVEKFRAKYKETPLFIKEDKNANKPVKAVASNEDCGM